MNREKSTSPTMKRREFPRVSRSCPVQYRPLKGDPDIAMTGPSEAVMNNISGGGISFSAPEAIAEGEMLALQVDLPGYPAGVISMGKVVWCHPSEDEPGRFDLGVEFWWVGWKDHDVQKKINEFISASLDPDSDPS